MFCYPLAYVDLSGRFRYNYTQKVVGWETDFFDQIWFYDWSRSIPCVLFSDVYGLPKMVTHTIHLWYIYLHLVNFYGKCRQIYHTFSVWEYSWTPCIYHTEYFWNHSATWCPALRAEPKFRVILSHCWLLEGPFHEGLESRWWWFQIFLFPPLQIGNDLIWRAYFSNGLKLEATNYIEIY